MVCISVNSLHMGHISNFYHFKISPSQKGVRTSAKRLSWCRGRWHCHRRFAKCLLESLQIRVPRACALAMEFGCQREFQVSSQQHS